MLLLSGVHIYSYFLSFQSNVFFSIPGSHPGYHIAFIHHVSLGSSRQWQLFRLALFSLPWQFSGMLFRYLVECPSTRICLMFFSWWGWGLWVLDRRTRVKVPFHHTMARVPVISMTDLPPMIFSLITCMGCACQVCPRWSYPLLLPVLSTLEGAHSIDSHVRCGELGPTAHILVWCVFLFIQFYVFFFTFFETSCLAHGLFYVVW